MEDLSGGLKIFYNRPQRVAINGKLSGIITLNTGAPQGAILSPILFSLYINENKIKNEGFSLLKYADDMALVGLMKVGDVGSASVYYEHAEALFEW